MIKKKLGVLAGAVLLASSAQAYFDQGNAVLFAYDVDDDDTYFVDLGVTGQDLVNEASVDFTDPGLATFLSNNPSAQWTIIASVNDTDLVGGPPAAGASLANAGVVSTSTSGNPAVGTSSDTLTQQGIMNDWLALVQTASGGLAAFSVDGTDPVSANAPRNGGFFNDSLIAVGASSAIFYSQADPADGATQANDSVTNQVGTAGTLAQSAASLGYGGEIEVNVAAVPVPAAAWLFGSALAGLTVIRRGK